MKQGDKELLFKDLCARLPYGVKISYRCNHIHILKGIHESSLLIIKDTFTNVITTTDVENIIPYMFPLSSMTEEQKNELQKIIYVETEMICNQLKTNNYGIEAGKYHFNSTLQVDWLNKNHFDYRDLIAKGLAIDTTGLKVYKEEVK